ncbi:MAG TPA: flagellar motor switch protein FliN [Chromatiales bacterium]|nr:flagellar motor switch protein FliN [Chromatiales bacterium]
MNDTTDNTDEVGDDWAAAMNEQAESEAQAVPEAAPADFQNLQADSSPANAMEENIEMILDIPVTVSVEIGRSKINIRNLLKLNQGSVVELDRLAGEPMDVIVNGTLIAHGEVVVVNEKFGVRLTDVISAAERVKKLK